MLRRGQGLPFGVSVKNSGIGVLIAIRGVEGRDHFLDFFKRRPDVLEIDRGSIAGPSQGFGFKLDIHGSGNGVCNDKGRGCQVIDSGQGIDSALEIAVSAQNRSDDQIMVLDCL